MKIITKLVMTILFTYLSLNLFAYPSIDYDWQLPARNISPIGISLGGINQVYAEDFGIANENPALLALRKGTYFSTTFRSNRMNNKNLSSVLNPSYLLKSKQFTYFTVSMPKFAVAYQPIVNKTERYEDSSKKTYHDLYMNSYVLSFAAQDEDFTKLTLGFNLKLIDGRQFYHKHLKENNQLILDEFIDDSVIGYSSDLGLTYNHNTILVGLTLKDVISKLYWNERKDNHLRQRFSFGVGFYNENSTFQLATQGRLNKSEEQTYHIGYGYSLNFGNATTQSLGLKLGMFSDQFDEMDNINYTMGFGYTISMFRIDISAISAGFTMDNTDYLFSVTVGK